MTDQDQSSRSGSLTNDETSETQAPSIKKPFIEPEISQPVDVLEATTFFQAVDSGGTG